MAKKKKEVQPGLRAVGANSSITLFYKWKGWIKDTPEDYWKQSWKHKTSCSYWKSVVERRYTPGQRAGTFVVHCNKKCEKPTIAIADMHTMQLVNAIKWCMIVAKRTFATAKPLSLMSNTTPTKMLAEVPQWRALLAEAKKRKLHIVMDEYGTLLPWFEVAWVEVVTYNMEK